MIDPDVLILGGGPAGAGAAAMLARLGARVQVLTRAARWSLGESIPPSTARLFAELDLALAVERGEFLRSRGNTVWWGNGPERVEPFPADAAGWQVERSHFDDVLLGAAEAAGASIERNAVVTTVEAEGGEPAVTWRIGGTAARTTRARWVLDCTGRAGVLARRVGRTPATGRATFALHALWEGEGGKVPDPTHTLVETTVGGWAWSVPVSPSRRHVTAMIEPPAGPGDHASLARMYQAELAGTTHLARLTRDAVLVRPPSALSAAPYVATRFAGPGWALVGDAASFIDPLSSFGVKKALAAAWLAAVVVHTALTEPALTSAAVSLFERREREAFLELSRQAARIWTGDAAPGTDDPAALLRDTGVQAAFTELKRAARIALRAAPDVTIKPGPTVRGQRVVLEPHLHCPWQPDGIRYLLGVCLPRVIELAPATEQVPDLYDQYVRAEGPTDLREFLGVLSFLVVRGVLVNA